jgi:hypothetical protein
VRFNGIELFETSRGKLSKPILIFYINIINSLENNQELYPINMCNSENPEGLDRIYLLRDIEDAGINFSDIHA